MAHQHDHNSPSLVSVMNHAHPAHNPPSYFFHIHLQKQYAQKSSCFINFFSKFWTQVKCFNLLWSMHDLIFREFLTKTTASGIWS